jgi:hypothetical protein
MYITVADTTIAVALVYYDRRRIPLSFLLLAALLRGQHYFKYVQTETRFQARSKRSWQVLSRSECTYPTLRGSSTNYWTEIASDEEKWEPDYLLVRNWWDRHSKP